MSANSTCHDLSLYNTLFSAGRAIHGTGVNKQEQKEALSLLRDIKTKHKMVHKETMERAASIESERNTNLNGAEPPPVQTL